MRERAGRRSIALHTNIDTRLGQIQADERKVRQVVLNLLSNAIKFTPEGGRIDVGAVAKDGFVEVAVTDTGIGIAPEDQEKVCEEFRQVGTAAKKVEGTGLGLTLCRKFVELHGQIWVKSELGGFHVHFSASRCSGMTSPSRYWRDLSSLERGLLWTGLVAFGVTFLAAAIWGGIAPDASCLRPEYCTHAHSA